MPKKISKYIPYIVLVLLTLALYSKVINFDFLLRWDDQWMIFNIYTIKGINIENIWNIFNEPLGGQYSPINQLIYTFIYSVFGQNPCVFHLSSLLWHVINVCLVFYLVKKILKVKKVEDPILTNVSFITSLLFSIHPLNVESIAWISASKVLLFSLFTLIGLIVYVRYIETKKRKFYLLTFLLFIFAFCCKEQALIFPLTLLLFDWFFNRRIDSKIVWIEKIPFILFAIFSGMMFLSYQYMGENNAEEIFNQRAGYSLIQRFFLGSYALVEYFVKLIVPIKLLHIYPFPMLPGDNLPLRFYIYPISVLVIFAILYYFRKQKILMFGFVFFIVNIFLTLHIIPMSRFAIVADRYVYLSSVGFFLVISWYVINYLINEPRKYVKIFSYLFITIYFTYLIFYTHNRLQIWKNNDVLNQEIRELLQK